MDRIYKYPAIYLYLCSFFNIIIGIYFKDDCIYNPISYPLFNIINGIYCVSYLTIAIEIYIFKIKHGEYVVTECIESLIYFIFYLIIMGWNIYGAHLLLNSSCDNNYLIASTSIQSINFIGSATAMVGYVVLCLFNICFSSCRMN